MDDDDDDDDEDEDIFYDWTDTIDMVFVSIRNRSQFWNRFHRLDTPDSNHGYFIELLGGQ